MPTRKQRRRRAKEQRHEYVWEDEEGNVIDPDELPTKSPARAKQAQARPAREPQAPSLQRTLRRAAIFAPIMFVVVLLLSPGLSTAEKITQTALIVLIFIPFSYLLDNVFWRSYQRRAARRDGGRS